MPGGPVVTGTAQVGDPVAGSMRKPQPMTARAVGRGISRREPSGMAGRSILLVRIVHDDLETDLAADAGVDPEAAPRQQGLAKIPLRRLCPGHLDLTRKLLQLLRGTMIVMMPPQGWFCRSHPGSNHPLAPVGSSGPRRKEKLDRVIAPEPVLPGMLDPMVVPDPDQDQQALVVPA